MGVFWRIIAEEQSFTAEGTEFNYEKNTAVNIILEGLVYVSWV